MTQPRKEQVQRNERLRQQRDARNWRQQDVADQLGITVLTVQRWERGTQQPSAFYRIKLSALFGLPAQELGFLEEAEEDNPSENEVQRESEKPQANPPAAPAFWTVPYARNPHFTGRAELLDQLAQYFASPLEQATLLRQAALTQTQALKGLGGIGKTQTAVEYAYRAREQGRYTHTFWISAANEEAILNSFVALAHLLLSSGSQSETDQRKQVAAVVRWLEQCPQPWLLIADNADDLSLIQPYLPRQGNGSLLLTTRASAAGSLGSSIAVESMGLLEGSYLLLQRAGRLVGATDDTINEAGNIVAALGYFPLAIDQAGAYIEETGSSLQDYLQIFERRRHTLLARRGRQATGYPDSVAATWSLSFERVAQLNPAATELLRLCAFMAPDAIPEELLVQGASYWPPALQEAVDDPFSFNEMLEALLAFSFVKRLAEERMLSLHRLVQAVQLDRLSEQEHHTWSEQLVRALHIVFPHDPKNAVASWPLCSRYLEQVQACEQLIRQHKLLLPEGAELLDRAATYLTERALYGLAEPLYQLALHIWEQQEEPESVGRARSLNNLARLSFWQDKAAQAELLHKQALAIREQKQGSEHPDVAESIHDLAGLYTMQGKYAEAEPLYVQALQIREQQLGLDSLAVAESINGLSVLYQKQGKYREAEALAVRALRIREQRLGPNHLLLAESLNDLAVLYGSIQGKQREAEPLYWRAAHIWEEQLGSDSPLVAYPLLNLALDYRKRGQYAEAEPLYLRALQIRERQLGENHRNMIFPLTGLAHLYRDQGKYTEAEPLFQRALRIGEQQFGPEHHMLAFTLDGLANLYSLQNKFTDAEQLYQRALRIREQRLGPDHSDVALTLKGLANLYTRQARYSEAEALFQRALHTSEQQLGPEHLETAQVLSDFAAFQQAQGHFLEAVPLYQRALTIREHVIGPAFPMTNETRTRLHMVLLALGRTEEAAALETRPD